MITIHRADGGRLVPVGSGADALAAVRDAVWIDMLNPTPEEERAVEAAVGIDVPTREDMAEIETSSRLYAEEQALFLTASILAQAREEGADLAPVTFVLVGDWLVTIRYHQPRAFALFAESAQRQDLGCAHGPGVLLALLETVVDRMADILEAETPKLDALSRAIFEAHRPGGKGDRLAVVLQRIGRAEELNGRVTESQSSIGRLLGFLAAARADRAGARAIDGGRLKILQRDLRSLVDYAAAHDKKIAFLLDATLGVINIRQSDIIKIFSVVAFVFLPPTLIASIYGMNFEVMPELRQWWGYPAALVAMVVSAVLPYLLFRRKGWL